MQRPRSERKKQAVRAALAVLIALVAFGVIVGLNTNGCSSRDRGQIAQDVITLVERYVAKNGRLPESLDQCDATGLATDPRRCFAAYVGHYSRETESATCRQYYVILIGLNVGQRDAYPGAFYDSRFGTWHSDS